MVGSLRARASSTQGRVWFLSKIEPDAAVDHVSLAYRVRGAIDVARLRRALDAVVARHAALRTTFADGAGGVEQVIGPVSAAAELADGGPVSATGIDTFLDRMVSVRFDLERGPLFRAALGRIADDDHVLLLTAQRAVADERSMRVVARDLGAAYEADGKPLPGASATFADHAAAEGAALDGTTLDAHVAHFAKQLEGASPWLDLPADFPRPLSPSRHVRRVAAQVTDEVAARTTALAKREGCDVRTVVLTAFASLLGRLAGADDVVVGVPVSRRPAAFADVVGPFAGALPARIELANGASFEQALRAAKAVVAAVDTHAELPFARLVQRLDTARDPSRSPLFQYEVGENEAAPAFRLGAAQAEPIDVPVTSPLDLAVRLRTTKAGTTELALVYGTELFTEARANEMLAQLVALLDLATASPQAPLRRHSLVTSASRSILPDPTAPLDETFLGGFHEVFARVAARSPALLAAADPHASFTYGELDARANQLARHLHRVGCKKGDRVAVLAHRSASLVLAVLGIAKAGGAFVLLDPTYPSDRLSVMLEISRPTVFVRLGEGIETPPEVSATLDRLGVDARFDLSSTDASLFAGLPTTAPDVACAPDDPAYVLFTSGSSGKPKGVLGRHGPLTHFQPWMAERFGFGEHDRFAMLSGLAHAPLQRDLLAPIQCGAAVVAPDPDILLTPAKLTAWMHEQRVTVAHCTPQFLQVLSLVADQQKLPHLRCVFIVGDALSPRDVAGLCRLAPNVTAVNYLGATEVQRATSYHVAAENGVRNPGDTGNVVSVGRGYSDVQLLVVNEARGLAGVGELGELVYRSPHLAVGYLDDPEMTSARFVDDFVGTGRAYRTGDLGRFRLDGSVDYVGRRDMQVKIRGFRVELGEIEAAIAAAPGVRSVAVLAREDVPGDKRVVAYVVGDVDFAVLRPALAAKLPSYMVPSAFVRLDALPLTPNRKLDRRALPAPPATEATSAYVAPRDALETALAAAFRDVLGLDRDVGVDESFFELGGHSLRATQLLARLQENAPDLPLRALFEAPSVAALAQKIREHAPSARADHPIVVVDRSKPLPASFTQARFWFLASFDPEAPTYNLPVTMRLRGRLDGKALERSLGALVERHEVLRTTFAESPDGPVQVIHASMPLPLVQVAAEGASREEREAAATALVEAHVKRPFDLAKGPVLRALLVRLADDEHVLSLVRHHVATDGWSRGIFLTELEALYAAFVAGKASPLAPLPLQYADFAAWQRAELEPKMGAEIDFWRHHLDGAPDALELPTDNVRPSMKQAAGDRVPVELPVALSRELDLLARRSTATPFMVLLAAYSALLARWSRQEHVVVGTPVAGRVRRELESIHGPFINSLALHTSLEGAPTFRELVDRTRRSTLDAFAHQEIPFERLVEGLQVPRDTSRTPIFQALFVFQSFDGQRFDDVSIQLPGVQASTVDAAVHVSELDLSLTLYPTTDGYRGFLEYDTALFERASMVRFVDHLKRLLADAVARPDTKVAELNILSHAERSLLLGEWNGAPAPFDSPLPHQTFEAQAARTPDAVAVRFGSAELTYAELDARANQVAHELRERGVRFDDVVAISLERSLALPVAVLGVLKAGAGYLPIDAKYPPDRRAFMAEDGRPKALLTHRSLPSDGFDPKLVVLMDEDSDDWKRIRTRPRTAPAFDGNAEGVCYLIYTSGSTGKPKGVAMHQRPLANLIAFQVAESTCGPGDKTLQFTPLSFDVHFQELFGTWASGGTLVLLTEEQRLDPSELLRIIRIEGVRRIFMPYVALSSLADTAVSDGVFPETLREVVTAGEALVVTPAIRELFTKLGAALFNHYGPSETHVVTSYKLPEDPSTWPRLPSIGRAIPGVGVYLLDAAKNLVPPGLVGEVFLGGLSPARGYHDREDLTKERFLPDPFVPGGRMYKAGDLARYMPSGDLEFLGRADSQVKVRGYRIEVGEIESVLIAHEEVREAVVVARDDGRGGKLLVAYVLKGEGAPDPKTADLKAHVGKVLPDYMVPSAFVVMATLPRTPSGKLDRRALPAPDFSASTEAYVAPRDDAEAAVAAIFKDVLGVERVGVHDDFFALGGHSLRAARVVSQIRAKLGVDVPVRVLFEEATVELVAKRVREGGDVSGPRPPALARTDAASGSALSLVQEQILHWEKRRPPTTTWAFHLLYELRGPVDTERLVEAVKRTIERQEALRTAFDRHADGFAPRIVPASAVEVAVSDVRDLTDPQIEARLAEMGAEPFAIKGEALIRFHVLVAANRTLLSARCHQLTHDPTEPGVLAEDVMAQYVAIGEGRELPPMPIRYVDYARWQRAFFDGEGKVLVDEARARIAGVTPASIADKRDADIDDPSKIDESFDLDAAAWKKLSDVFRSESLTPFMGMVAIFGGLVRHRTGANDLGLIAPVGLRGGVGPEVSSIVGRFLNHVPIRVPLGGDPTWKELFATARKAVLDASSLQEVPVARVLGVDTPFDHPFGRMVVNVVEPTAVPTLRFGEIEVVLGMRPGRPGARNDMVLFVSPRPGGYYVLLRSSAARMEQSTVREMSAQLRHAMLGLDVTQKVSKSFG